MCKVEFAALVRGCFAVQCWRFCLVLLGFVDWDFFFTITVVCEQREVILFGMGIYFGLVAGLHCSLYHHKGLNF